MKGKMLLLRMNCCDVSNADNTVTSQAPSSAGSGEVPCFLLPCDRSPVWLGVHVRFLLLLLGMMMMCEIGGCCEGGGAIVVVALFPRVICDFLCLWELGGRIREFDTRNNNNGTTPRKVRTAQSLVQ